MSQHPALALFSQASDKCRFGTGPLAALIREGKLHVVYQPIAQLSDGVIHAHEALIRGPVDTPLHRPDALLAAAAAEDLEYEFETACVATAVRRWRDLNEPGRLFVNISAAVLVKMVRTIGREALHASIARLGVLPRMLVFEITEHERIADMAALAVAVEDLRSTGASLALDDFGDGRSSLRLWSEIKPEFVKIDKYFTKDISSSANKVKTIEALQRIGVIFDTALVAEGIETLADLRVLRDMDIRLGQGYQLAFPDARLRLEIDRSALELLQDRRVAVFPELGKLAQGGHLLRIAVIDAPAIGTTTSNEALAALFGKHRGLHAMAVVDQGRPVAIINRAHFMNEFSRMYFREVWGRKSCMMLANMEPRIVERDHKIDELIGILTSEDQRYLTDGFIVTENGRYVGLGTGDQLVRSVTEKRIEAARHANPLTFLPGNVPISEHIGRLLRSGADFVACYADLNNFKPFNDQYGYWRGDDMIRLLARLLLAHCDPQRDFVGHVGGDDFVIAFQSTDWHDRCSRIIDALATHARELFDPQAQAEGGIQAEDRQGVLRFFPCTTLSIGAVVVNPGQYQRAEDVASAAAVAKHQAKSGRSGLYVLQAPNAGC
jgi:diguanylate cyclase (GGDEF)-like protein